MAEVRLTEQQQQVVLDRGGTLLVSAAAGSGKTKVLVDRVLRRIVEEGKNIHEFLIITFTNAAAAELRVKIADAISQALSKDPGNRHLTRQLNLLQLSQISTVHAFCGALLRQYGYLLDIASDYRMLEDSERTALLARQLELVLEQAYQESSPGFLRLMDTLGAGRTDDALGNLILRVYEKLLSQPYPEQWLRQQRFSIPAEQPLTETIWGQMLLSSAREQLDGLIQRYGWAVSSMRGDEKLEKQYLPAYEAEQASLERMRPALEGPWDDIGPALEMEYRRVSVKGYEDQEHLDDIKAVRADGKETLQALRQIFSRSEAELKQEQNELSPALEALLELVNQLDRRFSAEKRRKNLLDFSDQEHLAIRLLVHTESKRPTDVAMEVASRFTEIMVDEYQDSNRVQETTFTAISGHGDENRFLVGDVKQSIYGFRQAEPKLFLEKYKAFPLSEHAAAGSPRKLILSKNFRSRPEILEAVNHTFRTVMSESVGDVTYGPDESLYPGLEDYPTDGEAHVRLHVLNLSKLPPDSEETKYQREAQWVAGQIVEMLEHGVPVRDGSGTHPVRPGDIAILFRTRDPISIYSRILRRAGIPVMSDGGETLFDMPEVKVLVNLLRVLVNPHQDIPLLSVLCSPLFRLSNAQLAEVRAGSNQARFYDALRACDAPWCTEVVNQLEALRRKADLVSADALVWQLLQETGLLRAYSAMDRGQARRENLLAVYQLALNEAQGGFLYLYQLLRRLDRAAEDGLATAASNTDGVILTTMHRSKGLEYPVVFLSDLSRRFNFRELSETVLFDGKMGLAAKVTDSRLRVRYPGICYEALRGKKERELRSEELRILYVAMTRAKDYLIMTYSGEYTAAALGRLRRGAGMPAPAWAASDVSCLGDWVLLSALNRVEAGELFEVCGRPECALTVSEHPWTMTYETLEQTEAPRYHAAQSLQQEQTEIIPAPETLVRRLRWQYPHQAATEIPSKLTATQLKGRDKDNEAAEQAAVQPRVPQLRKPEFVLEQKGLSPTEQGTAVHLFLQYADYSQLDTLEHIETEKLRLEDDLFLTSEQLDAVDPERMLRLFQSPLGQRMLQAEHLIREFKFSILEDAAVYYPAVEGEQVLLQGVVDAALVEADGICVIDFKTDRVTEQTVRERAEYYRGQLSAYRSALERIFQKPVKEMVLYFLHIGKEVVL